MADTASSPNAPASGELFLIDGSGFIFRAFHALPPLTRPDGTPVNAVLGFTNMLMRLLAERHADRVAVVFDTKRHNYRNEIYPEYKANRSDPPPELVPQFSLIREATNAFNLPCLELEGFEADDLIATYARLANEKGLPVTVVSSDKDLMQLIRPGVRMMDPIKYKSIGPDEVREKFGVAPERVVDVQALAGDSVDNVPGVPGIGVKTAAQLIEEYGDLETLLARAGEIKQPKRREVLIEFAEQARISRRLVELDAHAPVPVPLEDLKVHEPDHGKLIAFLRTQGFRSIITRIEGELSKQGKVVEVPADPNDVPFPEIGTAIPSPHQGEGQGEGAPTPIISAPIERRYELVQDMKTLNAWIKAAYEAGVVAIDTETDSLVPARANLVGISLAVEPGRACYIPLTHVDPAKPKDAEGGFDFGTTAPPPKQIPMDEALTALHLLLEDPGVLKVGQNLKYDMQVLERHGIRIAPYDDTMLLSYVLHTGLHGHGMDELAQLYCGETCITYKEVVGTGKNQVTFERVPLDKALAYAAEDADITLRLHQTFKPRLVPAQKVTLYETIERPLVAVVADMEAAGIKVDRAALASLSHDLDARIREVEVEIHRLAGHPFNVGSPKQLGEVLFDEMGLPSGGKGKTGAYSTDVSTLEPLADQGHEIVAKVLDWRQLSKLKSTYTDALQEQINPRTGRVHTSFSLAGTSTGRLSSTEPNLQNIPIRTLEGRKIRKAFVAELGHKLISVDYSQIELRLIAEIAGIESLKEAFRQGLDIHAATASQVFGIPLEQITSEVRRRAKAINFGIIYGISGFGLGRQLGIPPGEANAFIRQYFARFPELAAYMENTKAFCREHGYVTTLFGRTCNIPGINDRNGARRAGLERQAINAPIQGTAADIIKRAMVRIPAALNKAGLNARMLLQVHDELLFEAPNAEAEATAIMVREVMENAATLSIPLVAEAGIGNDWDSAH